MCIFKNRNIENFVIILCTWAYPRLAGSSWDLKRCRPIFFFPTSTSKAHVSINAVISLALWSAPTLLPQNTRPSRNMNLVNTTLFFCDFCKDFQSTFEADLKYNNVDALEFSVRSTKFDPTLLGPNGPNDSLLQSTEIYHRGHDQTPCTQLGDQLYSYSR